MSEIKSKKALLILNGQLQFSKKNFKKTVNSEAIDQIIAVDGGANKARELALIPDIIIGDLDSVTEENYRYYKKNKVKFIKFPVEKDQTDSEIAVDYCKNNNITKLYFTAALGGRIDQQLANLNLLEYIHELGLKAKIISDKIKIAIIDGRKIFKNKKGFRLSLIPQTKKVEGLTITGCKYTLKNIDIDRSKSRGISNIIEEDKAELNFETGLLIYILEKID